MATGVKFYDFSKQTALAKHDWQTHEFYVCLTNTQPDETTDTVYADISEIAAGNGYTTGGNKAAFSAVSNTTGTTKIVLSDPAKFTATGGSMAAFRYAVLYNYTQTSPLKPLVAYYDYGSEKTLAATEELLVDMDASAGFITFA